MNDEYFVAPEYSFEQSPLLSLYRLGQEDPLDVLRLENIEGIGDVRELIQLEIFEVEGVSSDGRRVLVNLGYAAIVVPIEYE